MQLFEGSADAIQGLETTWHQLNERALQGSAPDVFRDYTLLIASVLDLMDTVYRRGKLSLDPDQANSYLILPLTSSLPNQVETLGRLRGKGSGMLASANFSAENQQAVVTLIDPKFLQSLHKDMTYLFEAAPEVKSEIGSLYDNARSTLQSFLNLADQTLVKRTGSTIEPKAFFEQGTQTITRLLTLYDAMLPLLQERLEQRATTQAGQVNLTIVCVIAIIGLLIYLYTGIYLAINQDLAAVTRAAGQICDGQLDTRITLDSRDEMQDIAKAFNIIAESIGRTLVTILQLSHHVSKTASSIAEVSHSTADRLSLQSGELQSSSTAVTELSSASSEIASRTESASLSARSASQTAAEGGQVVRETIREISVLSNEMSSSMGVAHQLEIDSNNISSILDVIRSIAEQTNLLALNAAIEAARAGEQGRGFAVVADEVRTLAARTQSSTIEIQSVIEKIQSGIRNVVAVMNSSSEHSNTAVEQAQKAGNSLESINESVTRISDMSTEIATATQEQTYVSEEITRSIVTISDSINETAAQAKNLAGVGLRLSAMAKEMRLILDRYTIDEAGFLEKEHRIQMIRWDDDKFIGVEEADRQHRQMVNMMNDVHLMSAQGRNPESIAKSLQTLTEYTRTHFEWEEEMLESENYHRLDAHKEEHARLLRELGQHQQAIRSANPTQIDQILSALNTWLIEHVKHSDKDYARFIQEKPRSATG